jgi:hypothetical protein
VTQKASHGRYLEENNQFVIRKERGSVFVWQYPSHPFGGKAWSRAFSVSGFPIPIYDERPLELAGSL